MKKGNAYFTAEAAMVLPMVIAVLLFVIYMLLFQYDRCLMEQDLGAMALWGSRVRASGTEELESKTRERIAGMYREKYMVWTMSGPDVSLERNRYSVRGTGQMTFPFPGWNFWSGENVWSAEAEYGYSRLAPVAFVRLCHRFRGQEREEGAEGGGH